jgi:hypothetical protein
MLIDADDAASGPAFAAFSVQVTGCETATGFGAPVIVPIERSAAGLTVTWAVLESFAEFGSAGVVPVTAAVFESALTPTVVAFKTTVMKTVAPLLSVGIEHVIGPVPLHVPAVGLADTNVPPENVSVIVTLVALDGPPLPTFTVNVAFCPLRTVAGPVLSIVMSACGAAMSVMAVADGGSSWTTPLG